MEKPTHLIEKFVLSADGTKVFAGALGDPSKPALVFIHGITLSSSIFNNIFALPELSQDFYLVSARSSESLNSNLDEWSRYFTTGAI